MNYIPKIKLRITPGIYYLAILFLPVFYTYFNIWNIFFLADAWHMLDSYITIKDYGVAYFFQLFAQPNGIHLLPIGVVLSSLESYFFGLNVLGFGILSLLIHFGNVCLVFYSIKRLTKNTFLAILGGIFFGVNYQVHEGVFWFASNLWTELSATFVMLGLLELVKYYQFRKTSTFLLSYLIFTLSLFLREYTFMLFPLNILFLGFLCFEDRKHFRRYLIFAFTYVLSIVIYFVIRFFFVYAVNPVILTANPQDVQNLPYLSVFYLFTLTPKILSSIIIPERAILILTNLISLKIYNSLAIAQTDVFQTVLFFDQLYIYLGTIMFLFLLFLIQKAKIISRNDKVVLFLYSGAFILIPIIFSTLSYFYWTFSRYLYLPGAIFSIMLFVLLSHFKKLRRVNFVSTGLLVVYVGYVLLSMWMGHQWFADYVKIGNHRKEILSTISKPLNFRNRYQIVFVKEPGNKYVSVRDVFDIGTSFGKVLLIWNWYNGNQKILPSCLYDPNFIYNSNNAYKYCSGKGYGYFQDIALLRKTVKSHKIPLSDITGFSYDIKTYKIENISNDIRRKLN